MEEILIALFGGGGVGSKSALIFKFITDHFIDEYDPTIEDLYKTHCFVDNLLTALYVIDTAGQEEYIAMRDQYMKVCQGFLVGYAITSRSSFDEVDGFIEQTKRVKRTDMVPMVLVANKLDLESERQVTKEEGQFKATRYGIPFFEISAKTGLNVRECIEELIRQVRLAKQRTSITTKPPKKGFFAKLLHDPKTAEHPCDPQLFIPPDTRKYIDSSKWEEIKAGAMANTESGCGFKDWLLQNGMLELHTIMAKLKIETAEDVRNTVMMMTSEELRKHEIYMPFQYRFKEAIQQWNGFVSASSMPHENT